VTRTTGESLSVRPPGPFSLTLLGSLDLAEQLQRIPPFLLVEHEEVDEVAD
jgi:hypothetical protein